MSVPRLVGLGVLCIGAGVVSLVVGRRLGLPADLNHAVSLFVAAQALWIGGRDVARRCMRFASTYWTWTIGWLGLAGVAWLIGWLIRSWLRSQGAGG